MVPQGGLGRGQAVGPVPRKGGDALANQGEVRRAISGYDWGQRSAIRAAVGGWYARRGGQEALGGLDLERTGGQANIFFISFMRHCQGGNTGVGIGLLWCGVCRPAGVPLW